MVFQPDVFQYGVFQSSDPSRAPDAELLLTINGVDVTGDVWEWRSVSLTDSWTSHPTLGFTLKQPFGSVTAVDAYSDVRLVNLLTGEILFEGIVAPGVMEQRDVDPSWVETDVSCVGYQALFDSSMLQSAVTIGYSDEAGPWFGFPQVASVLGAILSVSFADARVSLPVTVVPYPGWPETRWWDLLYTGVASETFAQFSNLAQVVSTILKATLPTSADGFTNTFEHPFGIKLIPGSGLIIVAPDVAVRGAAPVELSATGFGRPSYAAYVVDNSSTASGVIIVDTFMASDPWVAQPTNGYLVLRDTLGSITGETSTYFLNGGGASRSFHRLVSPQMPHDVLVGHELTFETARLGTITGTVQSTSTTFADGLYDQTSQWWPYFLNAGKSFDGTWNINDVTESVIPRRMRTTTMTIAATASAGVPASFVRRLRGTRSI